MTAAPDRNLERYDIVDRIAVGGMAEIFRAKAYGAHGFEKTLAIKRILPELARDPEFEERFIVEAKLAVQLAHANIVQVFDFGRFGESLFIAMEYVDGLDLSALMRHFRGHGRALGLGAALQISIEISRGLDFAHQRGVVHRDVSPSNVLLSRAGEAKIADFGIAQAGISTTEAAKKTRRIMGKWRYMAPEQARGDQLTPQSDIFSAGVVMHELFSGRRLFPGDRAEMILANIEKMPIPRLSTVRTDLPAELDDLLGRALERDPSKRWERAADMLRAFTDVSYKYGIIASALAVEAAVASVLGESAAERVTPIEPSGKKGLDDLIRLQLGASLDGTSRRTVAEETAPDRPAAASNEKEDDALGELTGTGAATMVRKGVDEDGVTMWEMSSTVAAAPSAIRGDRSGPAGAPATARESMEQTTGPTRSTGAQSVQAEAPTARRGALLAATMIAAAVVVGWAVYAGLSTGESPSAPRGQGPKGIAVTSGGAVDQLIGGAREDAAAVAAVGTLEIDSSPAGATVLVDGEELPEPTPTRTQVASSVAHRVEIRLAGHRHWSDPEVQVGMGERLRLRPRLVPQQATLRVTSEPPGATVHLDGELLGETPLVRSNLSPGQGRSLVLSKPDYRRDSTRVDLLDRRVTVVDRTLESAQRYGHIDLYIQDSWADVYLRGKRVGRAPVQGLRLPVGKHRLRLANPASGQENTLDVEVSEEQTRYYSAGLDSKAPK